MRDDGEVAEREELPVPSRGSLIVEGSPFVAPLLGHHVLEGVLVEPEQGRAAHAWANGAFQQIEDALGLEVVQTRFPERRSNLGVAGHVCRRLVIGFESLPQRLRVLHLVQDQRGEQPVVVLRGRLNQRSADDVALKQSVDLGLLARRLCVLANVEHVRDERRVLEAEYQHVQALDAGSGGNVRVAVAGVERGLEHLGIRLHAVEDLVLVSVAVPADEILVGLEEVGRARIEELVLGRDAAPLILNQNLEERVEEQVDERALDPPGNDLLLPILPLLRRGFENVFPALLERMLVLAVEEVVLEELRRRQAHPERVDGVEYLLLVLTLGEVDADELDVRLDCVPVDLLRVDVLEKVVVGKDDGRGALNGLAARGADDLLEILPVVLAMSQGDFAGLQDEISFEQSVGVDSRAKRLEEDDHGREALLPVDDGANLGHLRPGVAGGGLLQDDRAKEIGPLRGCDELHVAEEALPLLLSPNVRALVEGYFKQARSVEHAAYRRLSCIHP